MFSCAGSFYILVHDLSPFFCLQYVALRLAALRTYMRTAMLVSQAVNR